MTCRAVVSPRPLATTATRRHGGGFGTQPVQQFAYRAADFVASRADETARYHKIPHDAAAFEALFVDCFIQAHETAPEEIILDLDATDDPVHGNQEGRFLHGYYGGYCYLPLYIFCGRHLLARRLQER